MEKRRLVVVGGEIDGIMAAAAAAKENPELDIKILLSGKYLLLNKYQLAYFIQNVDEDMHSYMSGIGEEINGIAMLRFCLAAGLLILYLLKKGCI